jgi:excinuclease ABC subunit B
MYADKVTGAMKAAITETDRRRAIQQEYNRRHNITPRTVKRAILELAGTPLESDYSTVPLREEEGIERIEDIEELRKEMAVERKKMQEAARALEFEEAAKHRDRLRKLQDREMMIKG